MNKARLAKLYQDTVRPALFKELGLQNIMQVPKIVKVVVNVGSKEAVGNSKVLQGIEEMLGRITGQKPIRRKARKSIAGFKLREGMPIGAKVTLRDKRMYEFLDRLITLALPAIRDFQGVTRNCDGRGNYNLGIKEATVFPEEKEFDVSKKVYGMNITIHTSAEIDEHAVALLKKFGMPFKAA